MKDKRNSLQEEVNAFLKDLDDYSKPPEPPEPPQHESVDPRAIIPTHKIESYKDDCFSIAVPNCYKVNVNQYLGEQKKQIFQILSQHKKNILQANAGTGKNTLMLALAKSGAVQKMGCERLIIVVMVTTVGAQSQRDFQKDFAEEKEIAEEKAKKYQKHFESKGINAHFVFGGSGGGDKFDREIINRELGDAKVIICVADSLHRIDPLIADSFLVVDEGDTVARAASKSFRAVSMNGLFKYTQLAKRVLLMSATPQLIFTTNLHKGFNYNLIKVVDNSPNRKNLTFVVCGKKVSTIDKLEYIENIEAKEGVTIIKLDNVEINKQLKLADIKRGINAESFNGKSRECKEDNEAYQMLVRTGLLPLLLQILYTTRLISTGVSIKSLVGLIASLSCRSWQDIVQTAARPRHNTETGANMNVDMYVFVPKRDEPKRINKTRVEQRFCDILAETKAYCKAVNGYGEKESDTYTSVDLKHLATIDNGIYYPSIPEILEELYRQETNETSLQLLKKKIERADSRFIIDIIPFEKTKLSPELLELQNNIKAGKEVQKQLRAEYVELLTNNTIETVNAYLAISKNPKQKEKLQVTFQTGVLNKNEVSRFVQNNPVAITCRDKGKIISYLAKLVDIGINKAKVLGMLATEKQGALKEFSDSEIVAWRHKNEPWLGACEKMECEIDKAIITGINKAKQNKNQGKYKNEMSKKILINIIKKRATKITDIYKNPILTDTQCFARLRTLFEFETERKIIDGKKIQVYKEFKCKIELRGKKPQKKLDIVP